MDGLKRVAAAGLGALQPDGVTSALSACRMSTRGTTVIGEVPQTRWDVQPFSQLPEPIASRVRHTGFVRAAELFDNGPFSISLAEATAMDPQQRVLLEHGYTALHGAGLNKAR